MISSIVILLAVASPLANAAQYRYVVPDTNTVITGEIETGTLRAEDIAFARESLAEMRHFLDANPGATGSAIGAVCRDDAYEIAQGLGYLAATNETRIMLTTTDGLATNASFALSEGCDLAKVMGVGEGNVFRAPKIGLEALTATNVANMHAAARTIRGFWCGYTAEDHPAFATDEVETWHAVPVDIDPDSGAFVTGDAAQTNQGARACERFERQEWGRSVRAIQKDGGTYEFVSDAVWTKETEAWCDVGRFDELIEIGSTNALFDSSCISAPRMGRVFDVQYVISTNGYMQTFVETDMLLVADATVVVTNGAVCLAASFAAKDVFAAVDGLFGFDPTAVPIQATPSREMASGGRTAGEQWDLQREKGYEWTSASRSSSCLLGVSAGSGSFGVFKVDFRTKLGN